MRFPAREVVLIFAYGCTMDGAFDSATVNTSSLIGKCIIFTSSMLRLRLFVSCVALQRCISIKYTISTEMRNMRNPTSGLKISSPVLIPKHIPYDDLVYWVCDLLNAFVSEKFLGESCITGTT